MINEESAQSQQPETNLSFSFEADVADPDIQKDESIKASPSAFIPAEVSENAKVVLEHRYLLKNDKGEVNEDPDGLFRRVANALSKPDKNYGASNVEISETAEKFYKSLSSLDFLANSPTLMNAGTKAGTLSACFVLPLEDSMEGIMKTAHDAAMVQKLSLIHI